MGQQDERLKIMGIDPGVSGAFALIDGDDVRVWDMPVVKGSAKRKRAYPDAARIADILDEADADEYVIELVGTRPGQGISTSGAFMYSAGVVYGCVGTRGKPVHFVLPQVWKRKFGLIGTAKDEARLLAIKAFPGASTRLARKKDGGRADALLIGAYRASKLLH